MIVGLTGGIGAGKSAVAARLAEHGAVIVDADVLAHEVLGAGSLGLAAVVAEFGSGVLTEAGDLDRPRLGALVFSDAEARLRLNAIVHPLVSRRSADIAAAAPAGAVVVHDVPLLVENGLGPAYDVVVVVLAPEDVRIQRLRETRGMSAEQARARMAAQASDEQRRVVADVVLDNSGLLADLHQQVDELWRDRLVGGSR
ncbi:MAG: dephospho-CoA kinase [Geodermatophilaceae bacterium]|nr:dephospho-CoA kinase [Geodermatophilaceae bacterium]